MKNGNDTRETKNQETEGVLVYKYRNTHITDLTKLVAPPTFMIFVREEAIQKRTHSKKSPSVGTCLMGIDDVNGDRWRMILTRIAHVGKIGGDALRRWWKETRRDVAHRLL